MASKAASTTALVLCLNLVFFTLVSASSCPPATPKPSPATPKPSKPSPSASSGYCPKDALKFGVCAALLNGLVHVVGNPPSSSCCTLIGSLADAEAAACLCTAVKANVLGLNLDAPVSISVLLSHCGKTVPKGFKCA